MMTPSAGPLASGLDRSDVDAMLRAAEPQRIQALSATINLAFGTFVTVMGRSPWEGNVLWPIVGVIAAIAVWRLSRRLWRDHAIAVLAPAIGAPWGQISFASGWGAVEFGTWIGDLFSEQGRRFTAWQSHGRYRESDYRLSEATIWHRRHKSRRREVIHVMTVEVSVPQSFAGSVELRPRSGFAAKIDDLLLQIAGSAERRREVDPAFDAVFDTVTSQGTAADTLLTPGFRTTMLTLAARHPRMYLTARFEHGWFSLRLPIPHLVFASASLTRPLTEMADEADALWWDLTVPHRLIDALMGDRDTPLR